MTTHTSRRNPFAVSLGALLAVASAAHAQLIVADPMHLSPDGSLNRRVQLGPVTLGLQRTYEPGLVKDWSRIASGLLGWYGARQRQLLVYTADGATLIVAGYRAPEPGCVEFLISDDISVSGNCSPTPAPETSVGLMRNCFNEASTGNPLLVYTQQVNVNGETQHWAFVTIRAPEDFARSSADYNLMDRPVCLEATYFVLSECQTRLHPTQDFWRGRIARPPLYLVHGLQSSRDMWRTQDWRGDPFRVSEYIDYSKSANASFATNARVVPDGIRRFIQLRRSFGAVAVTQADIVAHSMGGLLTRIYAAGGDCRRADNWYLGDINRLITLDTPHAGSQWADFIDRLPFLVPHVSYSVMHSLIQRAGEMLGRSPYEGAVEDLRTYSPPILGLRAAPIPAHAIVGLGGRPATLTLSPVAEQFLEDHWWYVGAVKHFTDAFADDFAHFINGPDVFWGAEHDTIVDQPSQEGRLAAAHVSSLVSGPDGGYWEMTHTNFGDVPNLCSPPHDNCLIGVSASNVILQRARFVLNSRIGGGLFEDKFPAAPPRLVVQPGGGGPGTAASTTAPSQQPVKGLQIVSPTSVDSFGAGSAIPVVIRSINGFTADWVLVGIDGDLQVATFDGLTSTWRATVVCDLETIGALKVSAFGTTSSDRILTCDPVTIQTTIPSFVSVTSLTIDPDPVELYPSRPSVELNVVAHGSDGIDRKILSSATGISFTSTNSAIATVDGTGKVRSVALGSTSVTAFFASRSDGVAVNVYGLQGDHDNDQDVDLADFGAFAACFSGPKNSLGFQAPGIDCLIAFDYDEDGDVDLDDYARFLQVYTGPVGQDCNGNSRDDMLDILNGVASDCNHDGIPDACGQRDCNGNGIADSCDVTPQHFGFDEAQTFVSNLQADFVAVGDIDGDGLRDVLVSARTSNGVEALLNTGGGVLVPGVSTAGSINGLATAMAAGDLDNDGRTDVVVANDANSVSIFRQADFNGMFTIMTVVTLGTSASGVVPNALVLEDFDRDGDLDIAVLKGSTTGGKVEFIRNNNNGTFTRLANSNNARAGASSMAAADVDMDGKVDLAVANSVDNSVLVLRNTSTTSITFANASVPNTYAQVGWFANPVAIAAGDVTGDGKPDFLVCNRANGDASLMVNSGTGFFTITTAYTLGITPTAARGADLDGNGAIDFAIANDTMTAISALQSAPEACRMTVSAFSAAQSFAVEAGGALDLALGDLDGNGTIDVVSANGPSRTVSVLLNHTILPASHDRDGNGRPDECDDCNGNGKLDSCDIASGLVTDCNGNGIPDGCEIAAFDCDHNGIHDACEIANHSVPDCNGNGIPDSCDIASGTSTDCNGNGIPDECDIASGNFPDCNQNGVLDACEPDCNGNGIPDDCDLHFVYGATSPQLSPIGWDNGAEFFQLHTFAATPAASGNVTLRFFAKGDFSASDEYVSVYLNNGFVGNVFVSGASDCPGTPNQATITLSRDEYNVRRGPSGNMTVLMRPTTAVWTGVCGPQGGTFIQVQLDYPAATSVDLNGNGIPDECEH